MTNSEYIRLNINDNELAEMLSSISFSTFDNGFFCDVRKVFDYWASKEYSVPGRNFYETKEEMVNNASTMGYFEMLNIKDEDKWVRYGRTRRQGMNLFLSQQYDREYWERAIAIYDERRK